MKDKIYQELVEKRKKHIFPEGLSNPNNLENGCYDRCNNIGAWSQWQGNLDAKILVIGQDWGDVNYFIENEGKDTDGNPTNKNLKTLFCQIGFNIGLPSTPKVQPIFFTNAILGIKGEIGKNQMSGSVKASWIKDSNEHFTKELISIIQPKIIITLGAMPLYAMQLIYPKTIPKEKLGVLVYKNPIQVEENIRLFAFYHCGGLGLANRKMEDQKQDWLKMKPFINF
jgi:uracil-DNA glycosylase